MLVTIMAAALLVTAGSERTAHACTTGSWKQVVDGTTDICATSIAAAETELTFFFQGCGSSGFSSIGQGGTNLWQWNGTHQSKVSTTNKGHASSYNTNVAKDNAGTGYMWDSSTADWLEWTGSWTDIGLNDYSSFAHYNGSPSVAYEITSGGFIYGWGNELSSPPSTPVKVGINTYETVYCFPPGSQTADTFPSAWVMTSASSNNLYYFSANNIDCTSGTWTHITNQSAVDIANYGTYYLGQNGNIYDSSTDTCEFTGPSHPLAMSEDMSGCVSVIDNTGAVWQEKGSCGL